LGGFFVRELKEEKVVGEKVLKVEPI